MTEKAIKERRSIHIRKLICECIDSLNDPGGSTIVDMTYWMESIGVCVNSMCISNWVRELEKERIVFHFNIPFKKPKRYKLCIGQ